MKPDHFSDDVRLETWLASSTPPEPPAALRAAILAAAPVALAVPKVSWRDALRALWLDLGGARIAAPAFALALAIGISLGNGLLQTGLQSTPPNDDLLSLALMHDDYRSLVP